MTERQQRGKACLGGVEKGLAAEIRKPWFRVLQESKLGSADEQLGEPLSTGESRSSGSEPPPLSRPPVRRERQDMGRENREVPQDAASAFGPCLGCKSWWDREQGLLLLSQSSTTQKSAAALLNVLGRGARG